jgi:ribonuclease-3
LNKRLDAVSELAGRLGYDFRDPALLERALTHASVGRAAKARDNEVLEFIGDRVIGLLAAERLARLHPEAREGELAVRLNALVSRETCAEVARRAGFGPALRLAASETSTGGRDKVSILAGACEAVMAAIFQDGGLDAARAAFERLWAGAFDAADGARPRDPKTALQEWAQGGGRPLPVYDVVSRRGPDHAPTFVVSVSVEGAEPATGSGRSRQEAEKAAAAQLLQREGQG